MVSESNSHQWEKSMWCSIHCNGLIKTISKLRRSWVQFCYRFCSATTIQHCKATLLKEINCLSESQAVEHWLEQRLLLRLKSCDKVSQACEDEILKGVKRFIDIYNRQRTCEEHRLFTLNPYFSAGYTRGLVRSTCYRLWIHILVRNVVQQKNGITQCHVGCVYQKKSIQWNRIEQLPMVLPSNGY